MGKGSWKAAQSCLLYRFLAGGPCQAQAHQPPLFPGFSLPDAGTSSLYLQLYRPVLVFSDPVPSPTGGNPVTVCAWDVPGNLILIGSLVHSFIHLFFFKNFFIIVDLQYSVNVCLYSQVTQLYTYILFLLLSSIMFYQG